MRCLVTGGAGFIGSHIVAALVERGDEVRVLDNFLTGKRGNLARWANDPQVEIVEDDIRNATAVERASQGIDVVFHQAALPSVPRSIEDPHTTNAINVVGTLNVLDAARAAGVQRLVFASSSSVYGEVGTGAKREDQAPAPRSPYAVSKLAGESYCRVYATAFGLHTIALRYFNVFGPRQDPASEYAAVIPRFITAMLAGAAPVVYGDGEQTRDFTYIDNVVAANLLAATVPCEPGGVYNCACGAQSSLNQLIDILRDLTGYDGPLEYDEARPGDVRHSLADLESVTRDLRYSPSADLRTGLARTVAAFRESATAASLRAG